jgi:hypothetical protein
MLIFCDEKRLKNIYSFVMKKRLENMELFVIKKRLKNIEFSKDLQSTLEIAELKRHKILFDEFHYFEE